MDHCGCRFGPANIDLTAGNHRQDAWAPVPFHLLAVAALAPRPRAYEPRADASFFAPVDPLLSQLRV